MSNFSSASIIVFASSLESEFSLSINFNFNSFNFSLLKSKSDKSDFNLAFFVLLASAMPRPNSALSSNKLFAHAGPNPFLDFEYGQVGYEPP